MSLCAHCDAGALMCHHLHKNTYFHPVKRYGNNGAALLVLCLERHPDPILSSEWKEFSEPDNEVVANAI